MGTYVSVKLDKDCISKPSRVVEQARYHAARQRGVVELQTPPWRRKSVVEGGAPKRPARRGRPRRARGGRRGGGVVTVTLGVSGVNDMK